MPHDESTIISNSLQSAAKKTRSTLRERHGERLRSRNCTCAVARTWVWLPAARALGPCCLHAIAVGSPFIIHLTVETRRPVASPSWRKFHRLQTRRGFPSLHQTPPYRRPALRGAAHDALLGTERSQGHRTSTLGCFDECQPGSGWHPRCDCEAVAASHRYSADEATHHQKQSSRLPSKRARRFYPRR